MADARLAPDLAHQQSHTHWVVSSEPIQIDARAGVTGTGLAIFEFIRAVRLSGVLHDCSTGCAAVLFFLLDCVNGKHLRETGEMIVWPTRRHLAWQLNCNSNHLTRKLGELRKKGLISLVRAGGGTKSSVYRLVPPDHESCPVTLRASAEGVSAPARREPTRQRGGRK